MPNTNIVGDFGRFGFQISRDPESASGQMQVVDIFVNGQRITTSDSTVYAPAYVARLREAASWLKESIEYFQFHDKFLGKNNVEIHELLSADDGGLSDAYRFMRWGPTTDYIDCFLFPNNGRLFLSFQIINYSTNESDQRSLIDGVAITSFDLIKIIEQAADAIESGWHRNHPN